MSKNVIAITIRQWRYITARLGITFPQLCDALGKHPNSLKFHKLSETTALCLNYYALWKLNIDLRTLLIEANQSYSFNELSDLLGMSREYTDGLIRRSKIECLAPGFIPKSKFDLLKRQLPNLYKGKIKPAK